MNDIDKDLNRTFPALPYFSLERYGEVGQKALRNILQAIAVYKPKVGYCQSMNFLVGFLLMISGSHEKEVFWVFAALLSKTERTERNDDAQHGHFDEWEGLPGIDRSTVPIMDGLEDFYCQNFPMLHKYIFVF